MTSLLTNYSEKVNIIDVVRGSGGMADAHGSGPCVGNNMRVQVPSSARNIWLFVISHRQPYFLNVLILFLYAIGRTEVALVPTSLKFICQEEET